MSDEARATLQLENIGRAIRDLEGLPVDFRLARKLSEIQRMIADIHPLPVAPSDKFKNSCNRHADCNAATENWKLNHNGQLPGFNFHCHDEECEDCFGC